MKSRRDLLKAGLSAGSLFLPFPHAWVWAQSEGGLRLHKLPKVALILGNGKYKEAPLRNPVNDARAIGEALKAVGFAVTLKTDAGKAEMAAAVQSYVQELAAKKCVGLFYYAGHGIQLAWRNYMLPVDADVNTIDDIQKQGVEVHALLEGLGKAANPMNVVILDACRDNPFGNLKGVEQKGLSQMDAPTQTLLAFATSPGNVASDGDGANGLYTENLLREMKVPEAKVEDVFKRVRLGVRRKSNGAQVPWESTSLEEDFWFIPPREIKAASDTEKEKRFEEELALWEKLKTSSDAAALEDFLRRYPSGPFSELAQLQLNLVLASQGERRIMAASQKGNPFTKGSAEANTKWRIGDSYSYRNTDRLGIEAARDFVRAVKQITGNEVLYTDGLITDLLGNVLRRGGAGRIYSPNQLEPLDYIVGKQWTTQFRITTPGGGTGRSEMELRIVGREPVTVSAGTFDAFRIEGRGVFEQESGKVEVTKMTKWAAPDRVRLEVAMEETRETSGGPGAGGGGRGGGKGGGPGSRGGGGRAGGRGGGSGGGGASRVTWSRRYELISFRQA